MHLRSVRWVISIIFCGLTVWRFFTPKMEGPNQEKGSKFGSRVETSNPKTSQRGPFRPKKEPQKWSIPGFGWRRAPMLAAHPVFGTSYMNFDKPRVMDFGSSLREKEGNFENLCCESSQPTVEYHEYGSQDSNNVETKMNLQACIRKPLPSRCWWTGPPRKAAAAAAAILCQYIWGQSPTTEKKSVFEKTEFGSWYLDDIRGEDIFRDSHF